MRKLVFNIDRVLIEHTLDGIPQPFERTNALQEPEPRVPGKWPLWARGFKLVARPEDRGIGDVIARLIGPENSDSFRKWYKRIFKQDCGCTGRQTRWNALYPLK